MKKEYEFRKITDSFGDNVFVLTIDCDYYYKLHRSVSDKDMLYVEYECFKGNTMISNIKVTHIDDFIAWFFRRETESVIERLYKVAHKRAQKAIINAEKNES